MTKNTKTIFAALIFTAFVLLLALGLRNDPQKLPSTLINKPAPSLKLGAKKIDYRQLPGKAVLVNVFASWCVACVSEHQFLQQLNLDKSIYLLGLNYKDKPDDLAAWLHRYGNPYQGIALDPSGVVAIDWGVYGTPESFLIDKRGIIVYKHVGPINAEIWQQEFIPILENLPREAHG